MTTTFSTAITLFLTGMITVFVVLLLVVITGNLLIRFVNRFFPSSDAPLSAKTHAEEAIHPAKLAAITAAMEIVTDGKGQITNIKKE
jgi:oxaloacetate decarboxylase gamma subunit